MQMHGKRILKLLQKIFSWLPLATVIDQKVLVLHGGISDTTDLSLLARVDRHKVREINMCETLSQLLDQTQCQSAICCFFQYVSALRPPKKRHQVPGGLSIDSDIEEDLSGKSLQRRASLTYPKSFGMRDDFQNRSLQNFSDRIKVNNENKLQITPVSIYNIGINKSENEAAPSGSTDSVSSDSAKEEWKQVMSMTRHIHSDAN